MNELVLLHFSDLHCREKEINEFRIRRDAVIADLRTLNINPKLILISGDIAYSGQVDEYNIAQSDFIEHVAKELDFKSQNILICPGNHDIDRKAIDGLARDGITTRLGDTETAQTLLGHPSMIPHQKSYLNFFKELYKSDTNCSYYSRVMTIDRLSIGIGAFDSAWLCINDESKNRIFLTRKQVQEISAPIKDCDLKIALIHHPLNWFHPSEQEIVQQDLRLSFDIILTGHLHDTFSSRSITPSSACLEITSPSLFDGDLKGRTDGYNIYLIDSKEGKLHAKFRKFIRQRKCYDRNVEHAPNGEYTYNLPSSAFKNQISTAIARIVTESSNTLEVQIKTGLLKAQQIDPPILLLPPVQEMKWSDTGRSYANLRDPYDFAMKNTCILYGPPDAGSTIFLEELSQRINNSSPKRVAIYINYSEVQDVETYSKLLRKLSSKTKIGEEDLSKSYVSLLVDHVSGVDADKLQFLFSSLENISHMVICLKNDVLFDTLAASFKGKPISFLRLKYWGPSRLREFAQRYIVAAKIPCDCDAATKFIWDSLSLSDIPVTPFLVALYLRVFLEFGGKLTGISFVRLLERLEENSLDKADASSSYSIYNLRLMLRKLASMCYKSGSFGISRIEYENQIATFFKIKALDVDSTKFIQHLESSGIIVLDSQEQVSFSCVVFFNYYLSQAVESKEIDMGEHLQALHTALRLGDALAYYAGRHRDEESLATELMKCLEAEFKPEKEITSSDLEKYIRHLLAPRHKDSEKDAVTKKAVDSTVDYEKADSDFEEDQDNYKSISRGLINKVPPKNKIEKVAWNIIALKTFYNVFRNLEHIDADPKIRLLDRILDFHLQCNMDLIDLFSGAMKDDQFTSLCAYVVTIGGEDFLSQNVGSASLQKTIESLLETTKNDLKKFLLLCIYADLRLPGYAGRLQSFLASSKNIAIIEMGYIKIYELLIRYEGKSLPSSLISAFNSAFDLRQKYYGTTDPIDLQKLRDSALNEAKKKYLQSEKDGLAN